MIELTFTNALSDTLTLKSSELTADGEVAITAYTGFTQGFTAILASEMYPFQQGATTVGVTAGQRTLSLTMSIFRDTNEDTDDYIRNILNFASPYLDEMLIEYELGARHTQIYGRLVAHKVTDNTKTVGHKVVRLTFKCDSAFFEDYTLDSGVGAVAETNTGDYLAPLLMKVTGPCTTITLTKTNAFTTGEYMEIDYDLTGTDYILINTKIGEESVEVYNAADVLQESIISSVSAPSTFFYLGIGDTTVTATAVTNSPTLTYTYRQQYLSA